VQGSQGTGGSAITAVPTTLVNTTNAPGPGFNYNVLSTDYLIFCDGTGTGTTFLTVTLPSASGNTGRIYTVKRINSGTSTDKCQVTPVGTTAGSTTTVLDAPNAGSTNSNSAITVVSDGTKWWTISAGP
jgi:hypothetical protein